MVFRAVTIAGSTLISLNGANPHDQFFLSASFVCSINPIWFGLAHLHHLLDKLRSGIAWQKAIAMTLVQLMYTSIFGFIAAVFLVRTGSIAAPIISHMICNSVGLPDVSFLNKPRSEGSTELSCLYNLRYALLVIHFGGLVMFFYLLWQLTDIYVVGSAKEFNAYTNVLQFNTA